MTFAIDFKGQTNLIATEIPSAVGMRGLYVPDLGDAYDFLESDFNARVRSGAFRECSRIDPSKPRRAS
jgi:hypothetical protein